MAHRAKKFKCTHGLQQRDPLSPLIVISVGMVLAQFILRGQYWGDLHGFKASTARNGIPLIQFADDTMVLVDGSLEKAVTVKEIFNWFEVFTGLKVNKKNRFCSKSMWCLSGQRF